LLVFRARGVRGGPDPELIVTKLYPFKVEN
jgi:hypothetical protein